MKFSTLLKSNKLQGWEEYYIQYNNLVKYLKSDINRFKSLLTSEYTKITNFFNEIEQQTDEQRKVLLTILSGNLNDETPYKTNKKERFKHLDLIERIKKMRDNHEANGKSVSTEDFLTEFSDLDSQISDIEKNKKVAITESDVSMGGEESDFENIKIINKVDEEIKNIKDHKKRRMFNFDHFKINTPFEKRKKEKAFHELLQAINSVKSFRDINYMGLSIVIRKYKNNKGNDEFSSAFLKKLHQSHFGKSKKIDKMQKEVRYIYKKVFVLDDKLQAQIIFKRIGKKVKPDPWLTFLVGVLGSLLGIIIFNTDFEQNSSVKRVIFSIGLIQFGAFLFGLCNLVFIKYDINYNLIFNFDVISTLSPVEFIFYISVSMNFTFLACFFLIKSHPQLLMYSVVGLNIVIIILPFDILWLNSRLYFISVFLGTLASGFRKVYFKNFFFADVFQSFTPCFKMLLFEFGLNESLINMLLLNNLFPLIRIIQCINRYKETRSSFPHLLNMSKYWLVVLSGSLNAICHFYKDDTLKGLKIFMILCSSSFSIFWDFFLDWTIFRPKKLFPQYFYILGSLFNFLARYVWICDYLDILKNEFFFISLEIVRRFVWALFRVENEHVNNCTDDKSKMGLLFSKELFFIKDNTTKDETATLNKDEDIYENL